MSEYDGLLDTLPALNRLALAYCPGRVEGGRVSDHLWYFADVMPTISDITGAKPPSGIDGISFWNELQGTSSRGGTSKKQEEHAYLYWEIGGQTAVRIQQMKAIRPGHECPSHMPPNHVSKPWVSKPEF